MKDKRRKKSIALAYFLAWVIPGAGHWYAGYRVKAISLFGLIGGLFFSGLMMKGGILAPAPDFVSYLCAIGRAGVGFPWFVTLFTNLRFGDMLSRFGEIGSCYTTIAGLLNFLVILSIGNLRQEKD